MYNLSTKSELNEHTSTGVSWDIHRPVLLTETLEYLRVTGQARFIDATLGAGGHTIEIIRRGGIVLGMDADLKMLNTARERIVKARLTDNMDIEGRAQLICSNFRDIGITAANAGFGSVSGILFDLGVSSLHYDRDTRGFSFRKSEAPLDMRLNPEQGVKAADLLNGLRNDQLTELFSATMGKFASKSLAEKVLRSRPLTTVGDFLELTGNGRGGKNHPATRPFLALRMAVNSEIEALHSGLNQAVHLLKPSGRLVVISFHSGEDRTVKMLFRKFNEENLGKIITAEPVKPSVQEIRNNPRARSAKLRVFERNI